MTAAKVLCKQEYEYYKLARKQAVTNLQIGALANGSFVVTDLDPAIAPVIFKPKEESCTCKTCCAHKNNVSMKYNYVECNLPQIIGNCVT